MKLRRTLYLALATLLAITSTGLIASAQQLPGTQTNSQLALNLSEAQVFRIQALLSAQTREIRSLSINVQAAQEALSAAVAKGDPVLTATAVLSLDAADKALKNTQLANQKNLLALLSEYQKQAVRDYTSKAIPASE